LLILLENYSELFARTGEPEIPSLKALGLLSMKGTDLRGFFDLNVRRQAAAREYLQLFRSNDLDAILMPPAPHTALPLDQWTTASYTGLWNYLDYPAVVIPVATICGSDLADDVSNAKYGIEDARMYSLCMHPPLFSLLMSLEIMRADVPPFPCF
jgi:amidase